MKWERQDRLGQILRRIKEQRDALRVLGMDRKVEGLFVFYPRGTKW
jgi:hypothetical protein